MNAPVVLITGCSSGIGLASAVEFARHGFTTVATMRNLGKADELRGALTAHGLTAEIRALDVDDLASVTAAVAGVVADHGRIDVVVSNAGVAADGTLEELSLDDIRGVFETNFFGTVSLFKAVLPAMRERGEGRLIAVSSLAGALGQPFNDAYCASKQALEGLLESLHPVAAQVGVHVSVVEPGPVLGQFVQHGNAPSERAADGPYAASRARFQVIQEGGYQAAQPAQEIAAVLVEVATAETPVFRYQTSESVSKLVGVKLKDLTGERLTGLTARWV